MKISLVSLGCKVNQYENETLAKRLDYMGYDVTLSFEYADVYILNTCAVTNEAERKSRQFVTKINKLNPNCKIYIMGCAAKANSKQFSEKENVEFILGNNHKEKVIQAIVNSEKGESTEEPDRQYNELDYIDYPEKNLSEKVRKYIKIQDGCNYFCTYCAIPYLRGRSRSRDLENIIKEVNDVTKIANEIVITGINMSDYRIDNKLALGKVFKALKDIDARIRISSLEVNIIDDEFLTTLKSVKNLAQHFHLSMQSGCDRILKLMNRRYNKEFFIEKVNLIRQYFPDCAITTDVIIGFAKETEEDFLETMDTIKKVKFAGMHIFEYSQKEGTKGVLLGKSSDSEIKSRLTRINQIENQLKVEYEKKFIDTIQSVLIEEYEGDYSIGLTSNYIKVYVKGNLEINKFYQIKLTELKDGKMYGEIA